MCSQPLRTTSSWWFPTYWFSQANFFNYFYDGSTLIAACTKIEKDLVNSLQEKDLVILECPVIQYWTKNANNCYKSWWDKWTTALQLQSIISLAACMPGDAAESSEEEEVVEDVT